MKNIFLVLFTFLLLVFGLNSNAQTFNYTGSFQTYTVPANTFALCFQVLGAQGRGNANNRNLGGLGGEVTGTLAVTPGQVLRIYVGGGGGNSRLGGFNGGGDAGAQTGCVSAEGGGGGGASDIRVAPYGLANRVAVAGGGGGTGGDRMQGCSPGTGGGGGAGYYGGGGGGAYGGMPGFGGTQVAGGNGGTSCCGCPLFPQAGFNGALGVGGNGGGLTGTNNQGGNNPGCAAGAGGAATGGQGPNCTGGGGCPSTWAAPGGGGGSNYVGGLTATTSVQGVRSGNGQVIITCVVLPVSLTNFTALYEQSSGIVNLDWTTVSEQNNKFFTIEKSENAIDWKVLNTVNGSGNSNLTINYSDVDLFPFAGLSYYRLKQTDFNGDYTYSDLVSINIEPDYNVTLFPNPTKGNVTLKYSTVSQESLFVKIVNLSGGIVYEGIFDEIVEGSNNLEIPSSSFSSGMYFISMTNKSKTFNMRFIKE